MSAMSEHLNTTAGVGLGVYLIPGTFAADRDKLILSTNVTIGSTWLHQHTNQSKFCRMEFNFSRPGVQEWHNSVVVLLCETYLVKYIKFDYICPTGSPDGCEGFKDSRAAVAMYHNAIARSACNGTMRLGLSWMVEYNHGYWRSWSHAADSFRLDEDNNNSGRTVLVQFWTVQRAIERYRVFVTSLAQGLVNSSPKDTILLRPDMDNLFVANPIALSGLHPQQRQTMAMHWVGAGANLFEGGDLTQIDSLGQKLLRDPFVYGKGGILDQFGDHPMQPRNPPSVGCQPHWPGQAGGTNPQQLQAWIAGPNLAGNVLVIISNLGPDEQPRTGPNTSGTFYTSCTVQADRMSQSL